MRLPVLLLLVPFLSFLFCSDVSAGLGEPLPSDSLNSAQRKALTGRITGNSFVRSVSDAIGEEEVQTIIEKLPDGDLETIAQNLDRVVSGGSTTLAELLVQLVLISAVVGLLILLLIILGIAALFAGGAAASSSRSAPVGKAQYEEQRRKNEDTREHAEPDRLKR